MVECRIRSVNAAINVWIKVSNKSMKTNSHVRSKKKRNRRWYTQVSPAPALQVLVTHLSHTTYMKTLTPACKSTHEHRRLPLYFLVQSQVSELHKSNPVY